MDRQRDVAALRAGRTCYDHLAGRLGVALMVAWLDRGLLTSGDGQLRPGPDDDRRGEDAVRPQRHDPPAGWGRDFEYKLTAAGDQFVTAFGITPPPGRRLIRYCIDGTEHQHHLAGGLGRGVLDRLLALDWIVRAESNRAIQVTPDGERGLAATFGITAA